jgi:UbiD family decarboxylase
MGYYTPVQDNAVFEVLGVTRRKGAVFHSILCGSSEEVLTLELSISANIFQRISAILPGVIDVTCQPFVLHAVVKIKQQYEGHARQVMMAVLGSEPTWAKYVTVVDEDVDIYDMVDVLWAILSRARPDVDMITVPGTPTFYRDPHKDHWGRLAIDATAPYERRGDFVRKRIPGADTVDLDAYFGEKR